MTIRTVELPLDVRHVVADSQSMSAEEVVRWTLDTFGARVALSTSFQAEGMVVLDMAWHIDPKVRVLTIDTGRLPQQTYDLIDRVREHYGIEVEVLYPDPDDLSEMVKRFGVNLFYRNVSNRILCCEIRKVNPLNRALKNLDAWITGLRRVQTGTRASIEKVEIDAPHGGIIKVNPLADWSHEAVWDYIRSRGLPYNELYDQGYTSIGCSPCTRPIKQGEDRRAGRWWWEEGVSKECGIHMSVDGPIPSGDLD